MHLIENLMPTLVAHWTGTFKGLGDDGPYVISETDWEDIGAACKASGDTMPSVFGSRVPDIVQERYQFKAENWFCFLMFIGPAVLHGRLNYFLSYDEIDGLERGFVKWVMEYERLYYCHDISRVSCCTLPIYSLLPLARNIRVIGPVRCSWNFPTERFCGALVGSIQSRKHPFTSMAHRMRDIAQVNQLKVMYGLSEELDLGDGRDVEASGLHSTDYKSLVLVAPHKDIDADRHLRDKIGAYLATNFTEGIQTKYVLKYVPETMHASAKLKFTGGGDMLHSALAHVNPDLTRRDASFVLCKRL